MEKEKVIKYIVVGVAGFAIAKMVKKVFAHFKDDIYEAIQPKDAEEKLEELEKLEALV